MPTRDELKMIYENKSILNNTLASTIGATQFISDYYWSSTEYNSNYAYGLNFIQDGSLLSIKSDSYGVRAVRAL